MKEGNARQEDPKQEVAGSNHDASKGFFSSKISYQGAIVLSNLITVKM